MDKRTYIRCDDKECNEYKIQISQSGLYFNLSSVENGFLSKMMLDGSVFIEIVTVSTNVLVSYGTCEAMR